MAFYAQAINNTGGTGMLLGTLAMLRLRRLAVGVRRTLLFFVAATVISAAAELTGTKTGWPFGGYEYTSFLGPKLLGRVPIAVPLSWFYMGFASFVLADAIVVACARRAPIARTLWSIVLGTWLLVRWDLVLDPSMAAPNMQYIHFWVWHETGPYFGMPLRNLAGWFGTGLLFIAVGRLAWRERGRAAPSRSRFRRRVRDQHHLVDDPQRERRHVADGDRRDRLLPVLPAALAFGGARPARA